MANNTAGSCSVGFIFNDIQTTCKAFSYIKAYACKIGQISNPMDTTELNFDHFVLVDNERGATLRFSDTQDDALHVARLTNSYISALSRPTCTYCYGTSAILCNNNIGVQLLSVSGDGQFFPFNNPLKYDEITTP